ncbi:MAG: sigma-54-dependent Fis family transcriptional regulator [Williamsia sp.]|nr:sigma-54-dependent Fis family transcriptional regulator [Williamsia sp.]
MAQGKILIVDDEEQLRKLLKRIISLEGYEVVEAASLRAASDLLNSKPVDIVLCDVKLPDGNGVEYTGTIKEKYPAIEVVLLTAYGNIPDGVLAIKNGAFDYIVKGDDNKRILPLLAQAMSRRAAQQAQAGKIISHTDSFANILGTSTAIKQAIALAQKTALTDATVLLLGETGTGKEVFAHAIHHGGKRAAKNLVALNCSTFTKELLEGELFGHKAGAYTGALKDKKGLIELADGGTLFLDEIGEMPIELQAKLLRVLETGEFIKLGDVKTTRVDVRIIAATNRNLVREVGEGRFREDLYYRLNVFTIYLPPLRERPEDISALASHFLDKLVQKLAKPLQLSNETVRLLQHHSWHGNIRELRNVLERAAIIADSSTVTPADLPVELQGQTGDAPSLSLAAVEKEHIRKVLAYTKGNKAETARLLNIGLTTLYRKMEEYKLNGK